MRPCPTAAALAARFMSDIRLSSAEFGEQFAEFRQALRQMSEGLKARGLPPRVIELVKLHLSRRNGCAFSSEFHERLAREVGLDEALVAALGSDPDTLPLPAWERCLLRHAELINALADAQALAPTTAELSLHLCREHLVLVAMACAQINAWNRLGRSLGMTWAAPATPAATPGLQGTAQAA
jgi:AhpD family alkylhydroperoxidase